MAATAGPNGTRRGRGAEARPVGPVAGGDTAPGGGTDPSGVWGAEWCSGGEVIWGGYRQPLRFLTSPAVLVDGRYALTRTVGWGPTLRAQDRGGVCGVVRLRTPGSGQSASASWHARRWVTMS